MLITVPSHTTIGKFYNIAITDDKISCSCPDFKYRERIECKHIRKNINTINTIKNKDQVVKKTFDIVSHTFEDIVYCVTLYNNSLYKCT